MSDGFDRPSEQQLRVLSAWHDTLTGELGVTFLGVAELARTAVCRIGLDEDVPGCSWLELKRFGPFESTGYSSAIEWLDAVRLHDGRDGDGRPVELHLESSMLADAGWCWDVTSAQDDAHLVPRCRDGFAARFDPTAPVRDDWRWLLGPSER